MSLSSTLHQATLLFQFDLLCNSNNDVKAIFDKNHQLERQTTRLDSTLRSPFPNVFECDYESNGVKATQPVALMETNSTIADLQRYVDWSNMTEMTPGLTMELWMSPADVTSNRMIQSLPILTIGSPIHESSWNNKEEEEDAIGCKGYDLLIAQRHDKLEISYQDNDVAESCRFLLIQQPLIPNSLLQVVLVLSQGSTSIYFNGNPIIVGARNSFQADLLDHWNPNNHILLFSSYPSWYDTFFTGSIHQVLVHGDAFDEVQVYDAYLARLGYIQNVKAVRPVHLVASVFEPTVLVQGRTGNDGFYVGGRNASTPGWNVHVELISSPTHGQLRSIEGNNISVGDRIRIPSNSTKTRIFYDTYSSDFFTVPSSTFSGIDLNLHPERFIYRLIAVDVETGVTVLGSSKEVVKRIHVVHVNHPPILQSESGIRIVQKNNEETGFRSRPQAMVTGLELFDADRNIDRVRVDVWALNGTVTLKDTYRNLAEFVSCSERIVSPWQCLGDGIADRNMTFLVEPDDGSLILSNIQYDAFLWDNPDLIVIRVFDGIGGPCLTQQEHISTRLFTTNDNPFEDKAIADLQTIHDGCYQVTAHIEIPPMGARGEHEEVLGFSGFDKFRAQHIVFWAVVASAILGIFYCIPACMKCIGRRGRQVFPDDLNYIQEFDPREIIVEELA